MSAVTEMLLAKVKAKNGGALRPNSTAAKIAKRHGVQNTREFRRITELPRREWRDSITPEFVAGLSEFLKTPTGTMELWPIQAAALKEIHDMQGSFLPISVGGGKALTSLLAPVVLKAERPILLLPAALREQTRHKVLPEMRAHWKLHPNLKIIGYSELSLAKNANMLWDIEPDVIICDEAHALKDLKSGRTKRMTRYMRDFPHTKFIAMSGTISNRSIKDYWHIIFWCLKEDFIPLPTTWRECDEWAKALDEGVPDESRIAPGVLLNFCKPEDESSARKGYRRRLTETPGVIASGAEELGVSLQISPAMPKLPQSAKKAIQEMRDTWETPNGDLITEAIDLWRHARELALGFFYKWKPYPPEAWLEARKDWKKYVRETLRHNRRALDTELQVWNECQHADRKDQAPAQWIIWRDIKGSFKLTTVPEWIDDFAIDWAANWLKKPGIVWIEHDAFGRRLAEVSGAPYFGAGAKASLEILDATGPVICSVRAHGTGKNLQQWNRNLVVAPSSSGKTAEQLIGRTHRAGQLSDIVTFEMFQHTDELVASFHTSQANALYLEHTLGGRQRLNYADLINIGLTLK